MLTMPFLLKLSQVLATASCFAYPAFAKRKDDVVTMKNGDKFRVRLKGYSTANWYRNQTTWSSHWTGSGLKC